LQLDDQLHLRGRRGAAAAEGHGHPRHRVVRQHEGQQEQPRSGSVGRLRRSDSGRDGARLDERRVLQRSGVQGPAGGAQSKDCENHQRQREAAVNRLGLVCAAGLLAGGVVLSAQRIAIPEPRRGSGDSVTGAYEGWFYNQDGSRSFLIGYYNRNSRQELDIPIGPNNRIEPGGPDMGQPTHFLPGRQWGIFVLPTPREFKPTDAYTWTLVSNGQSISIPFRLHADYVMSPFAEIAVGNTPPVIKFDPNGKTFQGPAASLATAPVKTASVSTPMPLDIWLSDDM